jgi:hypothetical protein
LRQPPPEDRQKPFEIIKPAGFSMEFKKTAATTAANAHRHRNRAPSSDFTGYRYKKLSLRGENDCFSGNCNGGGA